MCGHAARRRWRAGVPVEQLLLGRAQPERRTLAALEQYNGIADERSRMALAADVNCMVAATHFLPLFIVMSNEEELVIAAKSTVYLSHRNRDPVMAAEFLARSLFRSYLL
jgi:hypothetical protein